MTRQLKREVKIGNITIGGTHPIAVQTMLNVPVKDIAGNVAQAKRVAAAGCQIVRVTVPTPADAAVVSAIKEAVDIPVVADIHFDYRAALAALDAGADKIRINPGNIGDDDRVKAVADACNAKNVPIRIGVNGGSLEKHILAKYGAPVPEAMVESALYHVRLLEKHDFDNIVISMAGNISVQLAEELAEKYFGGLPATHADKRVIGVSARHRSLVKHKDIEQVHIALAWPSVTRDDRLYDAVRIMNSVLGGSMSSRLFQEVREKLGLAYTVYSYNSAYADTGTLVVYAGVNAKNYLRSVDAVKKCIDDVKGGKIGREEFERGREQLKASSIFAQESTSSQMLLYGKEMLYSGKPYSFEERIAAINAVTADDLAEAIEGSFNNDGMAASLVGKLDKPLVI